MAGGYSIPAATAAAGVDPWQLAAQLPATNGTIDAHVAGFTRAGGHARDATAAAGAADRLTADSFRNDGVGMHPAEETTDATRRALGDGGERFEEVARMLHRVSGQLGESRGRVRSEIASLDAQIDGIVQQSNRLSQMAPLSDPSTTASAQLELFDRAVALIRTSGSAVRSQVDAFDDALRAGLPMLAAPPAAWSAPAPAQPLVPAGTPAQVAAAWRALTPARQAELLRTRPAALGNLDGLPGAVRDAANRQRLPVERARLEGMGNTEGVAAIDAITATLARGDRQLLALDTSSPRVTAAVGIGNIDTARNVAVFTPGMLTTVQSSLGDYDKSMDKLRRDAKAQDVRWDGDGSVAVVSWLGYEAPQAGWDLVSPSHSVALSDGATAGAGRLSGFLSGITAARPDDPHLTALGHSYGSVVTGVALQQDTGVDDAVFFGSPGVGTRDTAELRVPAGHAFVAESDGDPVADAARFGVDPNQDDRLVNLSTSAAADPDTGAPLLRSITHDTTRPDGAGYLDDDTTSRHNIAAVVAGVGREHMVLGRNDDWLDWTR